MAITTSEEANAVQKLLSYYLHGGAVPSHAAAQEAWMLLADASRYRLGVGWRVADVGNLFMPRGEDGPEPNLDVPDDCEACLDVNNDCRFHRGSLWGSEITLESAASALKVFARDPDQIGAVLDQDELNRQAQEKAGTLPVPEGLSEHEKQVRDAEPEDPTAVRPLVPTECPSCGHPERRFDPNTQVFSCAGGCLYTSMSRSR